MLGRVQEFVQVSPRLSKTVLYALQDMNTELEVQVTSELATLISEARALLLHYDRMQSKSSNKGPFNVLTLVNLLPKAIGVYERTRQYFVGQRFVHFRSIVQTITANAKEVIAAEWDQVRQQSNQTTIALLASSFSSNNATNATLSLYSMVA
jgi:hypothetical protein